MDLREGEKTVTVAAILNKSGLQRRFDAGDLGEVYISFQLFATCDLEIEFFKPIPIDHDNPSHLGLRGIDKHPLCHEVSPVTPPHLSSAT